MNENLKGDFDYWTETLLTLERESTLSDSRLEHIQVVLASMHISRSHHIFISLNKYGIDTHAQQTSHTKTPFRSQFRVKFSRLQQN